MKRKRLALLVVLMALCLATVCGVLLAGCHGGEKVEYSVTVRDVDEITPIENVTVKWSGKKSASAVTGADGKAKVELPAATYDVTLFNLPEGKTYTPAEVTSSARGIRIVLEKAEITYSVTVNKPDNTPAENVKVTWMAEGKAAGTATTAADGKASTQLIYGNYEVTVSDLPAGCIYLGSKQVTGVAPDATFTLENGETTDYTVTVVSEGGLKFKKYTVTASYSDGRLAATAETDDEGQVTFKLPQEQNYTVKVENIPQGYSYTPATANDNNTSVTLTLKSKVINASLANKQTRYVIGDIFHDYTFTTPYEVDGEKLTYNISQLLKEKRAIIINFWGTNCGYCVQEMPAMQKVYEKYQGDVELLAISNYMGGDSANKIKDFHAQSGYTFPMFRDQDDFAIKFGLTSWPTTVVIDRYGAIARIEVGALTVESYWDKIINQYISDEYKQTFVPGSNSSSIIEDMAKPDITVGEGHYENVGNAINGEIPTGCSISWYGEPEESAEYTWPFILDAKAPDSEETVVLSPSNAGKDNTFSFIYADVTMTAGQVLAFDFWIQSEQGADRFYVLFDGKLIYTISGDSDGWQTCFVYVDLIDGVHQLALSFIKDSSRSDGFDNVFIKNVRFTNVDAINQDINMRRSAAYGAYANGKYANYAKVELKDGYYYVKRDELQGKQYAGNDNSPMLFANFTEVTNWNISKQNNLSIQNLISALDEDGEPAYDFNFTANGVNKDWREEIKDLVMLSGNSDLSGLLPVDDYLMQILKGLASHISGSSNPDEWLEFCCFFSHYGEGTPYGNPIIGLSDRTAIKAEKDIRYTVDLKKPLAPYPIKRYVFTPERSGVYQIQSFIPAKDAETYASQIWIYLDDIDSFFYYSGEDRINRNKVNEQNFDARVYLEAGKTYYFAVAFQMQQLGEFEFSITYKGESDKYLSTCASGNYDIVDGHLELAQRVEYVLGDDNYYHVNDKDGELIYMDFKYTTLGNTFNPLSTIINQSVFDPNPKDPENPEKFYKVFDFSQTLAYEYFKTDEDGNAVYNYKIVNPADYDKDPTHAGFYIDYTEVMQKYCDEAMKNDGLLPVDEQLVHIMRIYYTLRTDSIVDGVMPYFSLHEWLQFCWYNKTVDVNNPV